MNNVMKPMTLMREDFVQNLLNLCNNSGLPFFVIESVLKDFTKEIHTASLKQFEFDKQKYNEELLKINSSSGSTSEEDGD